ncbi:myelin and lymphocyte protein-like [Polypterus senegalus]|uniref:myelin and lymphocyte protein-like n=1 Tax=Polypterus senegalus TaxID=55291 RepID=UPI00196318C9|nr:myelin and lymphocyte protein-like [Polypterus senegalus]
MVKTSKSASGLPTGCQVLESMPDILMIPELIFGGLVWVLLLSTKEINLNPEGWLLMVSIFCFISSLIWLFVFFCGLNQGSFCLNLDFQYHWLATLLYFVVTVLHLSATMAGYPKRNSTSNSSIEPDLNKYLYFAARICYVMATLLYLIHAVKSFLRLKKA